MAILAARNVRRGVAMGFASGQSAANALGLTLTTAHSTDERTLSCRIALLNTNNGILLSKTSLWYCVLRKATVVNDGN